MKHLPVLRWPAALAAAFLAGWLLPRGPSPGSAAATQVAAGNDNQQTAAAASSKTAAGEVALRNHVRAALAEGKTFDRISRVTAILAGMTRENASVIQGKLSPPSNQGGGF